MSSSSVRRVQWHLLAASLVAGFILASPWYISTVMVVMLGLIFGAVCRVLISLAIFLIGIFRPLPSWNLWPLALALPMTLVALMLKMLGLYHTRKLLAAIAEEVLGIADYSNIVVLLFVIVVFIYLGRRELRLLQPQTKETASRLEAASSPEAT